MSKLCLSTFRLRTFRTVREPHASSCILENIARPEARTFESAPGWFFRASCATACENTRKRGGAKRKAAGVDGVGRSRAVFAYIQTSPPASRDCVRLRDLE